MSIAQERAKANFKKAIAYRTKTGCSLKEAFAHVKKGTPKKAVGKNAAKKKKVNKKPVKKAAVKRVVKKAVKKAPPKKLKYVGKGKPKNGKKVYQYSLGGLNTKGNALEEYKSVCGKILKYEEKIENINNILKNPNTKKEYKPKWRISLRFWKLLLKETKTHARELKKLI